MAGGASVFAQEGEKGEVVLAERVVLRFFPDGKNDPVKRAEAVTQRLEELIGEGWAAADLKLRKENGSFAIYWKERLITTVDRVQARLNKSEPEALGMRWLENIRHGVFASSFRLSRKEVVLPVGGSEVVEVLGLLKGDLTVVYDPEIVEIAPRPEGTMLEIRGGKPGETRVSVERGRVKVSLLVRVKDWAGSVPDRVEMEVTGDPAPEDLLQQAALATATQKISLNPGATAVLREEPLIPENLPPGDSTVLQLPIRLSGEEYFPVDKTLEVATKNVPAPPLEAQTLLVSNRPEAVEKEGVLFQEKVAANRGARLIFTHQNKASTDLKLEVLLRNDSQKPARLWMLNTWAGPDRSEMYVGHKSAVRFLEFFKRRTGYFLTLAPGEEAPFFESMLRQRDCVSGVMQFRLLEGEGLLLQVKATEPNTETAELPFISEPFDPFMIHPRGTFPSPDLRIATGYEAGSGDKVLEFGRTPWLLDQETGEPNVGNYGAVYDIQLSLSNPTSRRQKILFLFKPAGGVASGSFIIEDRVLEAPVLKPPQETALGSVELSSGEKKGLRIYTLPESGSFYPAQILIRSESM